MLETIAVDDRSDDRDRFEKARPTPLMEKIGIEHPYLPSIMRIYIPPIIRIL